MKLTPLSIGKVAASPHRSYTLSASRDEDIILKGLVARYLFNEGAGTILYDSSGYSNHGTLNGPTWTGSGASFTTNDYIQCNKPAVYAFTTGYTIQIVLNSDSDSLGWIFSKHYGTGLTGGQGAYIYKTDTSGVYAFVQYKSDGAKNTVTSTSLTNGTWGVITAVWTGSQIRLDVNKTSGTPAAHTTIATAPDYNLVIGSSSAVSGVYYAGDIAEILVYNYGLSTTERDYNYNILKKSLLKRGIVLA
jgi:hypothetical protein